MEVSCYSCRFLAEEEAVILLDTDSVTDPMQQKYTILNINFFDY